jgi:hypothetical protein
MAQEPTLRRPVSWTASRLQAELAAELRALLVWTEPGGFRQQTCQSFTTRTNWFVADWCASSCQTLDLTGDLPQHLTDLGTVSRDVLGLRIGGVAQIDRHEFLTIEPVQPFSALVHQVRDGSQAKPRAGTRLRR